MLVIVKSNQKNSVNKFFEKFDCDYGRLIWIDLQGGVYNTGIYGYFNTNHLKFVRGKPL